MKVSEVGGAAWPPKPKAEPTQELLGDVHEMLDEALDFLECVYQASMGPDHDHKTTNPLRAVLDLVRQKVEAAREQLHDTIAWVEGS